MRDYDDKDLVIFFHTGCFSDGCRFLTEPSFVKNTGPNRGLNSQCHNLPLTVAEPYQRAWEQSLQ
jgi:hypothetical protein